VHRSPPHGIAWDRRFLHALVEQHFQHRAAVIGRTADQEIIGNLTPILLEPLDVGFEPAAGGDQRRGLHGGEAVPAFERRRQEHAVGDIEIGDLGVVQNIDAELFGGQIKCVQHRAAAAEEERVGPSQAERAAERRLPAHALLDDPVQDVLGFADHVPRQFFVGLAAGDAKQVFPEFFFGIRTSENLGRGIMRAAHVASMAGIAATIEFRRGFQHQHGGAVPCRADRGAKCGVAAADHQHIVFTGQVNHARGSIWFARKPEPARRAGRYVAWA
jgi:hypothetical protein